jgi:hypothetical protein
MRSIFTKVVAGTMVAGAALLVSACGGGNNTSSTNITETNYVEGDTTNTVSDDMTAVDAANGTDAMANDAMMSNMSGNAM